MTEFREKDFALVETAEKGDTDEGIRESKLGFRQSSMSFESEEISKELSFRLESIFEEKKESFEDKVTNMLQENRRWLLCFFVLSFFAFSALIVGLVSAQFYAYKDTRVGGGANTYNNYVMTTADGKKPVVTSGGYNLDDITSETPFEELILVSQINIVIGEGRNQTALSFRPTGFARTPCVSYCEASHFLHFYTTEATIVYHGEMALLTEPSERLQNTIQHINDISKDGKLHGRKLFLWGLALRLAWWITRKYVWKWVKDQAKGWVREQVTCYVQKGLLTDEWGNLC